MRRAACTSTSARPPIPASVENRMPNSPGIQPCTELETRAGIWRYDANRTGQRFSPAERFATGLRNGEGDRIRLDGPRCSSTQHGRDQLRGKLAAPLYAGAGRQRAGRGAGAARARRRLRLAVLLLSTSPSTSSSSLRSTAATAARRSGCAPTSAHLSRRSPRIGRPTICCFTTDISSRPRTGEARSSPSMARGIARRSRKAATTSVFQPLADGQGFRTVRGLRRRLRRRRERTGSGRAPPVGPRASDLTARFIFRTTSAGASGGCTYRGPASAAVAAAPARSSRSDNSAPQPPFRPRASIRTPARRRQPRCRRRLEQRPTRSRSASAFTTAKSASAPCAGCHGTDGKGSPLGPDLTSGKWMWGDGSSACHRPHHRRRRAAPREYGAPMPPMGGAQRPLRVPPSPPMFGRSAIAAEVERWAFAIPSLSPSLLPPELLNAH